MANLIKYLTIILKFKEAKLKKLFIKLFFVSILELLLLPSVMSDGVTGNTSGFGPEESRFDP